ncbi:hypothetical protein IJT10_06340 [bacterium]|nr:hypothetical protein [bacterium]
MNLHDEACQYHQLGGVSGKLSVCPTKPLLTQKDLSLAYTPGVAEPVKDIVGEPSCVYDYTNKGNLVAIVTNGSAILGLGDRGPLAAKPVMEGKAVLFKKFAAIDAFDIELEAQTPEEIIAATKAIAPTFGAINLEDIKAPECFEVEEKLQKILDIPVFHDDQHGTAIVVGAAILNGLHLVGKDISKIKLVCLGAGAAATACCKMLFTLGLKRENLRMVDPEGVIYRGRPNLEDYKFLFASDTEERTLKEAMRGADVFLGLSAANLVSQDMVKSMADDPLVFPLANPVGEISYEEVREARKDAIIGTGRSDYPNQINNVLGFPYIFRGALDVRARCINEAMKAAASRALAQLAREEVPVEVLRAYNLESLIFGKDYLLPKPLDPRLLSFCSAAVAKAATESGVAKINLDLHQYLSSLEGRRAKLI